MCVKSVLSRLVILWYITVGSDLLIKIGENVEESYKLLSPLKEVAVNCMSLVGSSTPGPAMWVQIRIGVYVNTLLFKVSGCLVHV